MINKHRVRKLLHQLLHVETNEFSLLDQMLVLHALECLSKSPTTGEFLLDAMDSYASF